MSVVVTQPEWSCPRSIDMAPMRLAGSIEWFDNTSTRGSGGEDGSTTAEVTSIAPVADHAKVHGQQMRSLANAEMRLIGRYHRVCSRLAGGPQCGQTLFVGLRQVHQHLVVVEGQAAHGLDRLAKVVCNTGTGLEKTKPDTHLLLIEPLRFNQRVIHHRRKSLMTATTAATALTAGTWNIEPSHSEVGFTVRHLGLSKVRGRFNSFSGTLTIGEDAAASSVTASIDLASVDTNNEARDGHLQSGDFFSTETHPHMSFTSTSVSPTSLTGDLTIKGITKPVTLDLSYNGVAVDGYETTRAGFSASGEISRSDFGIDFNAPLGIDGMLVSDKVTIELEIQAVPA
ncbi:UPF0312 protein [Nymphon striatum]|nr:UPF0312 protein [Nymphon striatum]